MIQHVFFSSIFILNILVAFTRTNYLIKVSLIYSFIFIFLFLAFRVDYGSDYHAYEFIFNSIKKGISSHGQSDRLFYLFNLYLPDFRTFIVVTSFLYAVVIFYAMYRWVKPKYYCLGVCFLILNPYLFFIHTSAIRQTLAMLFFLIAVIFIEKKNYFWFFIFVVLATGFHISAAILLLLVPVIAFLKIPKVKVLIPIIIIIAYGSFSGAFFFLVSEITNAFLPLYVFYLANDVEASSRTFIISSFFLTLNTVALYKCDKDKLLISKLGFISAIISILYFSFPMISRLDIYFGLFSIFSMIHLIEKVQSRINKFALTFVVFFLFFVRYVSFFNNEMWRSFEIYNSIF